MKKILFIILSTTILLVSQIHAGNNIYQKYNRENTVTNAEFIMAANGSNRGSGSSSSSYDQALADAKAEQKKAKKVGFEWNTIRKLMKKAKKDHKSGNDVAAIKKLNTAKSHAIIGQKQAIDQKGAGPIF